MKLILAILLLPFATFASEEEFLPWQQVRIVCDERPETGKVKLLAVTDSNGYRQVEIVAFGKKHELVAADLTKLRGFPLDSLRLTHEAGYAELGGHTVHLRLSRVRHEDGQPVTDTAIVSVSKGKGLTVSAPKQQALLTDDNAVLRPWWNAIMHTNDVTYTRIIQPWLQKHDMEFPAEGDGMLVVYQPWGFVSGAALYRPGHPDKPLTVFNDNHRQGTQLPLSEAEWEAVRRLVVDGKFFDLPYRNGKLGMDGASVYIEARINGRHHRVCHWQPDDPVVQRLANLIGRRPDHFFPVDRATPGAAWQAVGKAMWAGDKAALAVVCTERGYQSILRGLRAQEATADDLRTWAKAWANWPLRFTTETADMAQANFGPKVKEHGASFLKTDAGWKLDQWVPGE